LEEINKNRFYESVKTPINNLNINYYILKFFKLDKVAKKKEWRPIIASWVYGDSKITLQYRRKEPHALLRNLKELVKIKEPVELYEGIYSTGTLDNIEQSLCLRTRKGIVVITGCSHPHIKKILDMASNFGSIYGIIGGLHANSPIFLKSLKFICATHCTYYKDRIKAFYPERYVEGGVGLTIEI